MRIVSEMVWMSGGGVGGQQDNLVVSYVDNVN